MPGVLVADIAFVCVRKVGNQVQVVVVKVLVRVGRQGHQVMSEGGDVAFPAKESVGGVLRYVVAFQVGDLVDWFILRLSARYSCRSVPAQSRGDTVPTKRGHRFPFSPCCPQHSQLSLRSKNLSRAISKSRM